MLVLSRSEGEWITLSTPDGSIVGRVQVADIRPGVVRLALEFAPEVRISRGREPVRTEPAKVGLDKARAGGYLS
jgi:sRNA-binding carbon storage regulator CsrA